MQDELSRPDTGPRDERQELARILALSDGIFAISLTLLVLTLEVPNLGGPEWSLDDRLRGALIRYLPEIGTFALSFAIGAMFWISHHEKFRRIRRYDYRLLLINFLFLLLISFLPFTTELVGRYGDEPTAVAVYSGSLAATGFAAALLWWHATKDHRLVDAHLDPILIRRGNVRNLVLSLVFLAAAGLAFVDVRLAQSLWYLAWPLAFLLLRWLRGTPRPGTAETGAVPRLEKGSA